ncbi:MAG TPA: hypothetical protein VL860_01495, partial [Planctomycetota bacterium]|nr:hypothetical protein [Planctomycetota bacterium]
PAVDDDLRAGAADPTASGIGGAIDAPPAPTPTPAPDLPVVPSKSVSAATASAPVAGAEPAAAAAAAIVKPASPSGGFSPLVPASRITKSGQHIPIGRPNRPDGLPVHDNRGSQFQLQAERIARSQGDLVVLHLGGMISRDRGDSLLALRTAFEALAAEQLGRVILDCADLKTLHEGQFLADQRAQFRAIGPACDLVLCNLPRRLQVVCGMAKWDQKLKIVGTLEDAKRLFS